MFEQIKAMIVKYEDVEIDSIREDSRFIEDLGFNSYDFMCMVGEIEETFGIEVDERKASKILTVKDAVDYIALLKA